NRLAQLDRPVAIGSSTMVSGQVVDDLGVPRQGVVVTPLVVDELFGSVFALSMLQTRTGIAGRFEIRQLPSGLPAHQRLVLIMWHPLLEPSVKSIPVRGSVMASAAPMTCVAARLETFSMRELPANTTVTFFEEIPGLPVGAAAVRRTTTSNQFGQTLAVKVGRGRLWMLAGSGSPRLRRMERLQV